MDKVLSEVNSFKDNIFKKVNNIYLIGIGGVGMSGLALLLKERGLGVSGSDRCDNPRLKMLRDKGIKVFLGHSKGQLSSDIHLLVYSSAVSETNPELQEARRRGIYIVKRGELLAKLCQGEKTVAIAGSHGKTTTSALLSYLLTSLGYKPTVFVGGVVLNYSRMAWWGKDWWVIETDESDGSFLYCNPWVSVITNIDSEHLDYYKSIENLNNSFLQFARQTEAKVFGWGDQLSVSAILNEVGGVSFGRGESNQVRGYNFQFDATGSCFDLYIRGEFVTSVRVPLLGEHNCLNSLAAFAFFWYLGENLEKVKEALKHFKGTKRRFQLKAQVGGVTFIDDYAHHPTEIKAVLEAAHLLKPQRIFVVMQPHRFSRVKSLYKEFLTCFSGAHKVVITDIYSAGETNVAGVNAAELSQEVSKNFSGQVEYVGRNNLSEYLPSLFKAGDIVLALGAGDINILMEEVIDEFKKNRTSAQY